MYYCKHKEQIYLKSYTDKLHGDNIVNFVLKYKALTKTLASVQFRYSKNINNHLKKKLQQSPKGPIIQCYEEVTTCWDFPRMAKKKKKKIN